MAADYNAMTDDDFRDRVREFVSKNYPCELRFKIGFLPHRETKAWYQALSRQGWLAPGWPAQFGGMGLDARKRVIFNDVLDTHGCTRFSDNGVMMAGPLLIGFGTPAQRERFLPKILSGEEIWCQGYSEPGAGSDLASLRTEAVRHGDGWRINGQKIWTSRASEAHWCHMLVRTDKTAARPQQGISYFVVPLDAPGITIRPICNLLMTPDFCEVFLDDVLVPADCLVGELNKGWNIMKSLIGAERIYLGASAQSTNALQLLRAIAKSLGRWEEPSFMECYGRLAADLADHNSLYQAGLARVFAGEGDLANEGPLLKIHQTELYQRIMSVALDLAGSGAGMIGANADIGGMNPAAHFLASLPPTIYGGSSEVQRDVLAKQMLRLP